MGIEPYLLSSCIVGILAQRLSAQNLRSLQRALPTYLKELQNIGILPSQVKDGYLYHGKGCSACYGYGYRGRHGIYELMPINHVIQKQIVTSPDAVELRRLALDQGMASLRENGSQLVLQGITTIAEALRVIRGAEDL